MKVSRRNQMAKLASLNIAKRYPSIARNQTETSRNSNKHESLVNGSYFEMRTPRISHKKASSLLPPINLDRSSVHFKKPLISSRNIGQEVPPAEMTPQAIFETLDLPITPAKALKFFSRHLSISESAELLDYTEVFFLGLGAKKQSKLDTDEGDYKIIKSDHLFFRFEIFEILGKGSFGQVCRCFDHKQKEFVAIKIIKNQRRFYEQGLVEVRVLKHCRKKDETGVSNIVNMKECFIFRKHLCICFELLSMNIYELMKMNNFHGFSLNLIRRFAVQILNTLKFTWKEEIVHCDLKPENILLKVPNKAGIKVIDFGSSCFSDEIIYTYIQSRFYRAPEIILGISYTPAIDMWSFGCLLAELFMGRPLLSGEDEHEQLLCIMEVKGLPPVELLERGSRIGKFFDAEKKPVLKENSVGRVREPGSRSLREKVNCSNEQFFNLIESKGYVGCLEWVPENRISPEEALASSWITEAR